MMDMIKWPRALLEPDTKYSSKFSLGDEAVWLRIFDMATVPQHCSVRYKMDLCAPKLSLTLWIHQKC